MRGRTADSSDGDDAASEQLPPVEVALLQALIETPTLAAAARRIGYSERHARRLIGAVMRRLGAANKYAAVAIAVRRGLIVRIDDGCDRQASEASSDP